VRRWAQGWDGRGPEWEGKAVNRQRKLCQGRGERRGEVANQTREYMQLSDAASVCESSFRQSSFDSPRFYSTYISPPRHHVAQKNMTFKMAEVKNALM